MSICGYHALMGEGLRTFAQGLHAALREKAARAERSMDIHLQHEADEVEILSRFLATQVGDRQMGQTPQIAVGFLGLVQICQFLMGNLPELSRSPDRLKETIFGNVERLDAFLQEFEKQFEVAPLRQSAVGKTLHAWQHTEEKHP